MDERREAFIEFRTQFEAGHYEAAVSPAVRVVELSEQMKNRPKQELQAALMNLANTQRLAGDYVAAEETYLRVIAAIESGGRAVGPRLARANAGLAAVYHEGKRHDLAVERFETAVALSRRTQGLFTEAQLPMLEKYADSLTEMGRPEDALLAQKYRVRAANHLYGKGDIRTVPVLESFGRWYARLGAYEASRRTLNEAIEIVEETQGDDAPELIGPLTALAECHRLQLLDPTYRNELDAVESPGAQASIFNDPSMPGMSHTNRQMTGEGEDALERAVKIVESTPDVSPAQVADVHTQLGDWYQLRRRPERAAEEYERAWQAASRLDNLGPSLVDALFGRPVLLRYVPPDNWNRYADRPPEQVEIVNIELRLAVDEQGEVRKVEVISDAGHERLAERAARSAERARFRPRLSDGKPVKTVSVPLSQAFTLLVETEEEEQETD